ncbi:YfcL family protein [Ferrimonas pelagia]|uniref:YfcL family protein n=1 Tax=Ferrimonas pelagia TaxID=1177826 RepID=A0ABP9EC27_9GAMM
MLERWDEICHEWTGELLQSGSDDEVFASGYLQGHFAVVLSQLEQNEAPTLDGLQAKMADVLGAAKSELSPQDLVLIQNAWQQLNQRLIA